MSSLSSPGVQITAPSYLTSVHSDVVKDYKIVTGSTYVDPISTPGGDEGPTFYHYKNTDLVTSINQQITSNKLVDTYYAVTNIIQDPLCVNLVATLVEYSITDNTIPLSICTATSSDGGTTWNLHLDNKIINLKNSTISTYQYNNKTGYISNKTDLADIMFVPDTYADYVPIPIVVALVSEKISDNQPLRYSTDCGITWQSAPATTFAGHVDYIVDMDITYVNGHTYVYVYGWNATNITSSSNNYVSVLTDFTTWSDATPVGGLLDGIPEKYGDAVYACGNYLYLPLNSCVYNVSTKVKTANYDSYALKLNNILYGAECSNNSWTIYRFIPSTSTRSTFKTETNTVQPSTIVSVLDIVPCGLDHFSIILNSQYSSTTTSNTYIFSTDEFSSITKLPWSPYSNELYGKRPYVITMYNSVSAGLVCYCTVVSYTFNTTKSYRLNYDNTSLSKLSASSYNGSLSSTTQLLYGYPVVGSGGTYLKSSKTMPVTETVAVECCAYGASLVGFTNSNTAYSAAMFAPNDGLFDSAAANKNDAVHGFIKFNDYGKTWDIQIPTNSTTSIITKKNENRMGWIQSAINNDSIITNYFNSDNDIDEIKLVSGNIDIDNYEIFNTAHNWIQTVISNSSNTKTCIVYANNNTAIPTSTREYIFDIITKSDDLLNNTKISYSASIIFPENTTYSYAGFDNDIIHMFVNGASIWYFSYDINSRTATSPVKISADYDVHWLIDAGASGDFAALNCVYDASDAHDSSIIRNIILVVQLSTGEISQIPVSDSNVGEYQDGIEGWYSGSGYMAGAFYYVGILNYIYKVNLNSKVSVCAYNTEIDPYKFYVQTVIGDDNGDHVIAITAQHPDNTPIVDIESLHVYDCTDFKFTKSTSVTTNTYYAVTNVIQDTYGKYIIAVLNEYVTGDIYTPLSTCTATSNDGGTTWQYNYDNKISDFSGIINIKFGYVSPTDNTNGVLPIAIAQINSWGPYFMYSLDCGVTWTQASAVSFSGSVDKNTDIDATYYNGKVYWYASGTYSSSHLSYVSLSIDYGVTWTPLTLGTLGGGIGSYPMLYACGRYLYTTIPGYNTCIIYDCVSNTKTLLAYSGAVTNNYLIKGNGYLYTFIYTYTDTVKHSLYKLDLSTGTSTQVSTLPQIPSASYIQYNHPVAYGYIAMVNDYLTSTYIYDFQGNFVSKVPWSPIDPSTLYEIPFIMRNLTVTNNIGTVNLIKPTFEFTWRGIADYAGTKLDNTLMSYNNTTAAVSYTSYTVMYSDDYNWNQVEYNYNWRKLVSTSEKLVNTVTTSTPREYCSYGGSLVGFNGTKAYSKSVFALNDGNFNNDYDGFFGFIEFDNYGESWSIKIPDSTVSGAELPSQLERLSYLYSALNGSSVITDNYDSIDKIDSTNSSLDISTYDIYTELPIIPLQDVKSNSDNTESCYFGVSGSNNYSTINCTFVVLDNSNDLNIQDPAKQYNISVDFAQRMVWYGCFGYDNGIAHVFIPAAADNSIWYFNYNTLTDVTSTPIVISGNYTVGWMLEASAYGDYAAINCNYRDGVNNCYSNVIFSVNLKTSIVSQIPVGTGDSGQSGWFAGSGYMADRYYYVGALNNVYRVDLESGKVLVTNVINSSTRYVQGVLGDSSGKHVIAITAQYDYENIVE